MEGLLEGRSSPPEALDWFSKENLTSVRLVQESVLGLRQLKRGYVAKYAQRTGIRRSGSVAGIGRGGIQECSGTLPRRITCKSWGRGLSGKNTISGWNLHFSERALPGRLREPAGFPRSREPGNTASHSYSLRISTDLTKDVQVHFCDPQSPWQRGRNTIAAITG